MAEEITVKKDNKKLIYIIAGAVAALAIIVGIILITTQKRIDDSFFISDDTKYVLNTEDNSYGAIKNHVVVYYDKEDNITGAEAYLEFGDEETAKTAYNELNDYYNQDDMKEYKPNYRREGKYIVNKYKEEDYAGMTASQMKALFDIYSPEDEDDNAAETDDIDAVIDGYVEE